MSRGKYGTIAEEAPEFVAYLANKEDAMYQIGVKTKVDWICPCCGYVVRAKSINKVISRRSIPCDICGDGVSRPEKIVASGLMQARITYERQKLFEWSGLKRYDFYLPNFNTIIEVNGAQHYGYGFKSLSGVSLDDQINTDITKMELAKSNGISNYLVINASNTMAQSIVPQLSALLRSIGITTVINTIICERDAMKSNIVIAANMWNDGMWNGEIAKYLGVAPGTSIEYLKKASAAELCNYTTHEAHLKSQKAANEKHKRRVICLTTGKIFESIKDAADYYHISSKSNIIRACTNHGRHAGMYNGEHLSWAYI